MNQARDISQDLQDWLHEPDRLPPPRMSEVGPLVHRTPQQRGLVPPLPRRFPSMFSATKYLVAGVIVALVGGFLITGIPSSGPDQGLPLGAATTTTEPLATDEATVEPPDPAEATGRTRVVAKDGSGEFSTVTAAVAAAHPGDTVLIRPGTYEERVLVEKDLVLFGDGDPAGIAIAATDRTEPCPWYEEVQCALHVRDAAVTLSNLTLRAGPASRPNTATLAMLVREADLTLEGVIAEGDVWTTAGGTEIRDSVSSGYIRVEGDAMIENTEAARLWLADGQVEVRNNRVGHLSLWETSGVVERNEIEALPNPLSGPGVQIEGATDLIFRENTVSGHKTGLRISRDDATRVVRNLIGDNEVGIRFNRVGSTIVRGNAFCHNETDIFHKLGTAPAVKRSCKEPWTSE